MKVEDVSGNPSNLETSTWFAVTVADYIVY